MDRIKIPTKQCIGRGGFAFVYHGTFKGIPVAVKRIEHERRCGDKEEKALKMLNHTNIVKLHGFEEDEDFRYYALELCAGSLDQLFLSEDNPRKYRGPPLPRHIKVLLQLANGLAYIHSKGLVHRDIKPGNVLISLTKPTTLKWADFGLTKETDERGTYEMSGQRGTLYWMAPEILDYFNQRGPSEPINQFTTLTDVFSAGCLFFSILTCGIHPFGNNIHTDVTANIQSNNPVNLLNNCILPNTHFCHDCIKKMLDFNSDERWLMSKVISFLRKKKKMELYDLCRLSDPTDSQMDQLAQVLEEKEHPDLNKAIASNDHFLTPLEILCWHNRSLKLERCIQMLVEREKKNYQKDYKHKRRSSIHEPTKTHRLHGTGALFIICCSYSLENLLDIVQLLIDQTHVDLNGNNYKLSPSMPPIFRELLCNSRWKTNLDPFEKIVYLLIKNGANINSKEIKSKWSALHYLAVFPKGENRIEIAKILIKNGIDLNCKDNNGKNALILHIDSRQARELESVESIELTELFIDHGIDINARDKYGYNALHRLLDTCGGMSSIEVEILAKMFIENGIDVNAIIFPNIGYRYDWRHYNVLDLLFPFYRGLDCVNMLKMLIEHGLSIKKHSDRGYYEQPNVLFELMWCTGTGNRADFVKLMIEKYEIDVNEENTEGWNALHYLTRFQVCPDSVEIAKLLIEKGINVNAEDNNGNNALHYILLYYRYREGCRGVEIAKLLLDNGINIWARNNVGQDYLVLISGYKGADFLEMYQLINDHRPNL